MSSQVPLAQHIVDPRLLADELDAHPPIDGTHSDMYSGLANYVFGSPCPSPSSSRSSNDAVTEAPTLISPLLPAVYRASADRTPRPSVSGKLASSSSQHVSSHPSQGAGRPASSLYTLSSTPRRQSTTRDSSYPIDPIASRPRSRAVSGSDSERSEDPTPSTDPINAALFGPHHREVVLPDNASQHTFGRASRRHGVTAALSQDGATPSSSSVSVTTSRSSSRASMRTEQFSSDDELEFDYYDGSSSPVTFAKDFLVGFDEDADEVDPGPSTVRSTILDGRRGSLPMAIPGAPQSSDAHTVRSREGSILTLRRPSRSWDAASARRSSLGGDDSVILPKSEPLSRADWLSVEAQLQVKQQQQQLQQLQPPPPPEHNVYDGIDLQYILSRHSEGSIRSFKSRLSFVQGPTGPRRSSPHLTAIALGSTATLPIEDTFLSHIRKHDRGFEPLRYFWSFQREKADAASTSSRRRQIAHHHRIERPAKELPSRLQEMWRCGHVGRFKVDRLVLKPQSADPTKGVQQRIHVRHIPDPFLLGNTTSGPHSVIHKHSRAAAFSIFRSHTLFSGRYPGATIGPSSAQTHMNMRFGIMLAPNKVQQQYTSTKTMRQFSTHGLLDGETRSVREKERDKGNRRGTQSLTLRERDSRDKERRQDQERSKSKSKVTSKSRSKDKSDKKHRTNPEGTESSTATSSAGSVTTSAIPHTSSAIDQPAVSIQPSPTVSSSTTVYGQDSVSRPISPTSLLSSSISYSTRISESETSSIPSTRHHHDHRDSIDSEDHFPTRTTHAEAFSTLDPNDIENLRAKALARASTESGPRFAERFFRVFRSSSRVDDHSSSGSQPRAFQPPWLITAGRDQQEENDRVLSDLNASFRDVGLLHTNPHKPSKSALKRRMNLGVLDQIPDDCLYMLLPLWPGETDTAPVHPDTSSTASFVVIPENRQYLLVYYVPFGEAAPRSRKHEKKKAKQSHSSDSGPDPEAKAIYLHAFRVVARVITYDELRLSGIRVPSDGLAINGPEWEAISYPASIPLGDDQMTDTVVCQCHGRDRGFDFQEHGLLKLGLCTREEPPTQEPSELDEEEPGQTILTPIGRAAVEMIWLGCLAISSFGPT